jgi:D-serine deaminase-like pyridoxal phosphate-dependent protein
MTETLDTLPTPALVLDRAVLRRNLARMSRKVLDAGIDLRPHLKTCKSATIGRQATAPHSGAITVSTLAEARYFAHAGFRDILYGVGIVPSKLPEVAALRRQGTDLHVVTDNTVVAGEIVRHAEASGETFSVFIEIDSGGGRAGLQPGSAAIVEVGRTLRRSNRVSIAGVMTHAGHSYHARSVAEVADVAETERQTVVGAAKLLREAGLPCPRVSAGSTPTATHARSYEGLTEVRPGVYVFMDLDQAGIGACAMGDIAVSVLASVIGHYPHRNQALIDAGALALSKDISAQEFMPDAGYGTLKGFEGLSVQALSQEHGFVAAKGAFPYAALPIGTRVRVLPNHVCITAAGHDRYHVVDSEESDGVTVLDVYDRVNGW